MAIIQSIGNLEAVAKRSNVKKEHRGSTEKQCYNLAFFWYGGGGFGFFFVWFFFGWLLQATI